MRAVIILIQLIIRFKFRKNERCQIYFNLERYEGGGIKPGLKWLEMEMPGDK